MQITWFGHSAFALESDGRKVLVDPFLTGNPTFAGQESASGQAASLKSAIEGTSHIVLTHGHGDHIGDTEEIAKDKKPVIFCNYDLGIWMMQRIAATNNNEASKATFELMNTGGTVENDGVKVTLVRADHSSGVLEDGVSHALGLPNGAIIRLPGAPTVWHMGDTDLFSDMALIDALYKPEIVMIPIGDRFTMGPESAAYAVRHFLKHSKTVIPVHFGTFGLLTGTVSAFKQHLGDKAGMVLDLLPCRAHTLA